jgi:hypothetical protein
MSPRRRSCCQHFSEAEAYLVIPVALDFLAVDDVRERVDY